MGPLSNVAVLFPHHPASPSQCRCGLGPGVAGALSGHLHFVDPATTQEVEQLEEPPRLLSDQGPNLFPQEPFSATWPPPSPSLSTHQVLDRL